MGRDHKLDLSAYRPSTYSTCKPDRDRSRSPERKRPRSESWRPSKPGDDGFSQHNGRRWRGETNLRVRKEFRERSPILSREEQPRKTPAKSHQRTNGPSNGTETKGLSDKIHSLRRLLEKASDMPADIRQEKERELQGYVADQQLHKARREKNAITSRYHFVRFLERKKAEKWLKKLEKSSHSAVMGSEQVGTPDAVADTHHPGDEDNPRKGIDETSNPQFLSNAEKLTLREQNYKRRLHEAIVDLNYTLFAPLDQKYISLYPGRLKKRTSQDALVNDDEMKILRNESGQKPPLWYEVEKAMGNGTLEVLREGKLPKPGNSVDLTFRSITTQPATGKRIREVGFGSDCDDGPSEDDFFER